MLKTANYRQAIWLAEENDSLENLMINYLSGCPDVESTKFEYKPEVDVQISERSTSGSGIGCYFTLFAEGQPAATIENGGSQLNRRHAPRGEEFLKSGIYLVIEGDHVGYVAEGHTNDGQITGLLAKFMSNCGAAAHDTQFALMARADRREIERLLEVGVKSIDLGISAFNATVEDINATTGGSGGVAAVVEGIREVASGLHKIVASDRSPQEIEAASDLQAKIQLGYDGRGANALLPNLMSTIAEEVNDNAEQFKIVTRDDVVITRDKLVVKRDVNVEGDEVALDPTSTFAAIRFALARWREANLFEQ